MNHRTLIAALAAVICSAGAFPAYSEPLSFAVYDLTTGGHDLMAQGSVDYTAQDIEVVEWGHDDQGNPLWRKSLKLADGFNIGLLSVPDKLGVSGFGLWISNDRYPKGFSWEWFDVESGDIFRKLQNEGCVRVTQSPSADGSEIQSIEFLTDVTLRFKEDIAMDTGLRTQEVVVSRGSILRVSP